MAGRFDPFTYAELTVMMRALKADAPASKLLTEIVDEIVFREMAQQ